MTHAATNLNTADDHHSFHSDNHSPTLEQQEANDNVLYLNSEGGIISGSVGSLNRFITPHYRRLSRTSTTSSTSSESSNTNNNTNKPTEVI